MSGSKHGHPIVDRVRASGFAAASSTDLIGIGFARRAEDASEEMGRAILKSLGRIQALSDLTVGEIRDLAGLDEFESIRALALIELGRRSGGAGKGELKVVEGPEDVMVLFAHLRGAKQEHFCATLLDTKNQVLKTATIHIGTLTSSVVGPREVFREAIREGASSIIVVHNHPSGDPTPSLEDHQITNLLTELGEKLDIPVLDHIIVGYHKGYSFQRRAEFEWFGR